MFLSLLLFFYILPENLPTDSLHYFNIFKEIHKVEVSPFRGEPYIFEVTQPFLSFNEKSLLSFDISNKGKIPLPPNLNYYSTVQNIAFEENAICPPYLNQNLYTTFSPSPTSLNDTIGFPVYLTVKGFNKSIPFSQLRLFRGKKENEHIQFTFGKNITRYGRLNITADYLEEKTGTKRSIGFDTDLKLPFNASSHFLFLDIQDETSTTPLGEQLLFFSISRKEGTLRLFRKTISEEEKIGTVSDIYLHLPYQHITVGFDYPNINSSYYQLILVDMINPFPLIYVVPRFLIDANKEYSVSLGSGYHPLVDLFLYGNVHYDKNKTLHFSLGLRNRTKKWRFESFIFSQNKEVKENSGLAISYNGEVFSNFHLSSLIVTKLNYNYFFYLQPFYEKPFKNGKLRPAIFSGLQYTRDDIEDEIMVNVGIIIAIVDVSLFFVFDDINDIEQREYRFGVQWDFYD
jgi:hypothetical protein